MALSLAACQRWTKLASVTGVSAARALGAREASAEGENPQEDRLQPMQAGAERD